ncbi:MAG: CinA family nicotinamide mononucleotide deamidase-related protein, partial [Planctomycetota bacterium]
MRSTTLRAVILSIGDELITGQIVDSNSAFLSTRLGERGIETLAHWTIGDDRAAIADVFDRAAQLADVVVATGGLGPTLDDLTRDGLADALGVELLRNETSLAEIEAFFQQRGLTASDVNRRQAFCPAGAEPLANTMGTAPGVAATLHGAQVFCLPGVPHEMRNMFAQHVEPRLTGPGVTVGRVIHTFGMGESDVGKALADLMSLPDVRVGTTVAAGVISVRIRFATDDRAAAEARVTEVADDVKQRLGRIVVGEGETTLPVAVGELLRANGQHVATAESCTGGTIGQLLTSVSGSSDIYLGGVVAYANEIKQALLDVPADLLDAHGAVSEPVASAMAEGCRQRFGSEWALA